VSRNPRVVILGAGMSSIACADHLSESFDVEIYEKSRGVGGRLCSRRHSDTARFHFGAQFCTSTNPSFYNFLKHNGAQNFLGPGIDLMTNQQLETKNYYIHQNGMQSLLKESSSNLNIHFETKATHVNAMSKTLTLGSNLQVPYDVLISSLPLPQAKELIDCSIIPRTEFSPCIAVGMMVKLKDQNKFNAFKNVNAEVSWVGSSKFYNPTLQETWVVQLSPAGSQLKKGESDESLINYGHHTLESLLESDVELSSSSVFRWKFAQCERATHNQPFTSLADDIFAIGDWHISPRVESAFLSGRALAEHLNGRDT